ncbi:OmpA family protein [Actinomadura scrupuli]|uniref:OmpA family protein n=1 Tax=Actinomadura scrupuli TaxID=559629 RepID=UPI003D97926D
MTRVSSGTKRLLVLAVLGFVVAACGGSPTKPPAGSSAPRPASASARPPGQGVLQSQVVLQTGVRVDLLALDQVSDRVIVARLRAVGQSDQPFYFENTLNELNRFGAEGVTDPNAVSAITLFDGEKLRRYWPLVGTDGRCLCTRSFGRLQVPVRGSLDFVAAFPAPSPRMTSLDLLFPNAPPFLDVPVRQGGDAKISVGEDTPAPIDTTVAPTKRSPVLPVYATSDSPGSSQSDDGSDLSIRLSADVLFALNKAVLNPTAQDILRDVAAKIDRSTAGTVRVDGYTDNSGNDGINNPLSERRAQSVQAALQKLVTRSGVTYQPKGHGSANPVASNDTEEGRRLNRRVTVTFTSPKDKPAAAGSATPAPSGPATTTVRASSRPPKYGGAWPADPAKLSATVSGLRRDSHGNAVVTVTVRNDDPAVLNMAAMLTTSDGPHHGDDTSGVLVTSGKVRYRPLYDSALHYLGPAFDMLEDKYTDLGMGRQLTVTAMYRLPAAVTAVTVEVPGFQPAPNVPVK